MRVLVVAEPSLFEEGIEELLRQEEGLEIVGREKDPQEAARRIKESSPDVIILIDGEAGTGLDVDLLRLAREGFQIKIVEVHLATNTLCIYRGDHRSIGGGQDLVGVVRQLCEGLAHDAQVAVLPATAEGTPRIADTL